LTGEKQKPIDFRFEILDFRLKNGIIEESELTDESGGWLSDTIFFISARMNPGACTLADEGQNPKMLQLL
jgi:hypothetical protein